ncbi:MAG: mechanosensitive ion channel family protein [Puniceicoccales bacterium]|jgi:MscS family membrane protein|nr:mechanosensitive ion channel family protein [Puniceicoccales bacterium]
MVSKSAILRSEESSMNMPEWKEFLTSTVALNGLKKCLWGMCILALSLGLRRGVRRWMERVMERTSCEYLRLCLRASVKPTGLVFLWTALFAVGGLSFGFRESLLKVFFVGVTFVFLWMGYGSMDCFSLYGKRRLERNNDKTMAGICPILEKVGRGGIVVLGGFLTMGVLGYSINGIFTVFGLSGAVLAFAMKDILVSFFNTLSIVVDQPFRVGDYVEVAGLKGVVDSIGIRTTRLRTTDGTQLVVPNGTLVNGCICNHFGDGGRWVRQILPLDPGTSGQQIADWVTAVTSLLKRQEEIDPSSVSVYFSGFSPGLLELSINYRITHSFSSIYADICHRLNLIFLGKCEEDRIGLARPVTKNLPQ